MADICEGNLTTSYKKVLGFRVTGRGPKINEINSGSMLLGRRMSRLVRFAELYKHSNFFISYVIMQPYSY